LAFSGPLRFDEDVVQPLTEKAMRYTEHIVQTPAAARVLGIALTAILLLFLVQRLNWNRPGLAGALLLLTLMPFFVSNGCLRFLGKQELQHPSPTPEMQFIFGIATTVPMVVFGAMLMLLNNL
jgi:hypothetical protein